MTAFFSYNHLNLSIVLGFFPYEHYSAEFQFFCLQVTTVMQLKFNLLT